MFHTVSLFPSLLDFQLFAPLILRIGLGVFLFLIGVDSLKKQDVPEGQLTQRSAARIAGGVISLALSVCVLLGLFTQGAALLAILLLVLNSAFRNRLLDTANASNETLLLLGIMCVALILSGAGMPAIDLPL